MSKQYPWFKCKSCNLRDKETHVRYYVQQMLARTQSMFRWTGLLEGVNPDARVQIPQRMLELYLQTNGNVCIAERDGKIWAFTGGLGGEPDPYYRPTLYTVANPALNFSESYKINENCIVIPSDSSYLGFLPMFERYATMLVENDLSMYLADINLRVSTLISAEDDRTAKSAEVYLKQIEEGKQGVVAESTLVGGLKTQPWSSPGYGNIITQLIELQQYLKAGWYNDIGVQSNYNMKREAIGADESALQYDSLLPLVDDMLRCRKEGVEKVNAMFGTEISVELNSVWEDRQIKVEQSLQDVEETPDDVDNAEGLTPEHNEGGESEGGESQETE